MLNEYLNVFVTVYLNDILIYLNTEKKHEKHVRKVLQKLKEAEFTIKQKYFTFKTVFSF